MGKLPIDPPKYQKNGVLPHMFRIITILFVYFFWYLEDSGNSSRLELLVCVCDILASTQARTPSPKARARFLRMAPGLSGPGMSSFYQISQHD